jgi:hypothetical protein
MKVNDIADKFDHLIEDGKIEFKPSKIKNLPNEWARLIVAEMIESHGLGWKLGNVTIRGSICIKLDDEYLQYIDIFPNEILMWCTDNHHKGVHPDEALAYLLNKDFGERAVVKRDKNGSIITIGDFVIADSRTDKDREKMGEKET